MKIKDKTVFVYDIESFPNLFTCAVINSENKNIKVYEISDRKNELADMCRLFLHDKVLFCGYNNIHYDNMLIHYCLINFKTLNNKPVWEITKELKEFSNKLIELKTFEGYKQYKYANLFPTLDLCTMLFSEKLRVGLKSLQVTMHYDRVFEYEGDFNDYVPLDKIDQVIEYNKCDILSTDHLLSLKEKDINLRLGIEKEYGIDVLSKDGVNIGKDILKLKYLQDTGKTWKEIKDLRSPCDNICFKDVILPFIEFETDILKEKLTQYKNTCVNINEKWNDKFVFFDSIISFGMGGIHSVNDPEIIKPNEDELLMDWDAASLYPSLLIEHEFYPRHLGKEFLNTYSNIRKERIEAKHNGNKVKNETLKLCLNSVTGLMQNEYSWMYSPKDVLKIRINGQLLLLKLAEMLILSTGCRVIQYNTDGIFILLKKNKLEEAKTTIKEFETLSKLSMEGEEFEAFYQYAINDYIAVHKGYADTKNTNLIKTKGFFGSTVIGKGMAPEIIADSLINYFVNGISVETTLHNCNDIKKFLTFQKVNKEFKVEYNKKQMPHINRYFMSRDGYRLKKYKLKGDKRFQETDLCASSGVTIVNDLTDFNFNTAKINYEWYKSEIYKIIYALEDSLNPTLF